ncbi:MAG TPA: SusC/RagA family TonB-linked outer membrane protein, partial [Anseongella sp.]|nr:SusC/RagA family TonB-linked outer membrane protein [Anseongella sp.]
MREIVFDLSEMKKLRGPGMIVFLWAGLLAGAPLLSHGAPPALTGYESRDIRAEVTVSGQVTSQESGEPLPGVSILVKGTSNGTSTNADGNYTITVDENAVLVFSFLGFQTQEVPVNGNQVMNVALLTDLGELDRVVVVGYGTQKKASLTGSIVDVEGETLEKAPVNSLSNSLAGRMPGVIGLNRSGQPGENGSQILIRGSSTLGSNAPLFVIDGVPGREGFDQIDPRDIESISVLKDASAAIYGARAANGVILITTKRGATGKPTIRYTFNQGITQPTRLPEYADAATLAEFQNAQLAQGGQQPKFTAEEIEKFRNGSDPVRYPNTNWIESTLKDFSAQSRHSLSLRGGSEAIRYYLAGNYGNQDGMFREGITNSKVVGVRSNIDGNVSDNIKLSLDLSLQEENNMYPSASADAIIEQMYRNYSYLADFYPNGLPGAGYSENRNPRLMVTDAHGYRDNKNNIYQTKASIDINIPQVQGLGVDGFIAYDRTQSRNKTFEKPAFVYQYDAADEAFIKTTSGQILA